MLLSNSFTFKAFDCSFSGFEFQEAIREPHPFRAWFLSVKNFNTMLNLKTTIFILAVAFAASSQNMMFLTVLYLTLSSRHSYLTTI